MRPTAHFIKTLEKKGFDVIDCITVIGQHDAMGYYLKKYWRKDDLMKIDQDSLPTLEMVYELQDCPFDLCVNPTISYPVSTDHTRPMMNQIDKDGKMYEIDDRPHSVHYGGTGVCKIGLEIQKSFSISQLTIEFPMFDSSLFQLGIRNWHCHYPLHDHMKTKMEYRT